MRSRVSGHLFSLLTAGLWALISISQPHPAAGQEPALDQPHPFGIHDLLRMERLGEPVPSPDNQWVVFTVRNWNPSTNKATTSLWLRSLIGPGLRQLTSAQEQSDTSPTWSPDGHTIAFVSGRGGSRQIWTIAIAGGEARRLTDFPIDVDNLRWSPDGRRIAFSADVYPDADMKTTAQREQAKADNPVKAMKFDRLFIRHWDAWEDGKRNHVFVQTIQLGTNGTWRTTGEPQDLMKSVDGDCPTKPFGGAEEFQWSPDGMEIAYTVQLGADSAWSTDLSIYTVPVSGGPATAITAANKATDTGPVYSPDGRTIAYRAMARPGFESDRFRITLFDRATGRSRTLAENWDRSPGSLAWSPDSKSLMVSAGDLARQRIFRVSIATGQPELIVADHYNTGIAVIGAAAEPGSWGLVFGQDSFLAPLELFRSRSDGSGLERLTHFNDDRVKLARRSEPEEFFFTGALGEKVQAWIFKPVDFAAGNGNGNGNGNGKTDRKYPVALVIHGGPQGAIEDHFHYRWNPQTLTGAGYAVICVNFHGSTGFGQAFTDSISGDWGGKPFEDLMNGLDHALQHYPWLDGQRVGALGASYGGWMVNWINGHTNRFRCLVNHDGGFDELANYYTTEELWFPEWEFQGTPWTNRELYEKFSPSRFVDKWQTPTLVIHGALDYRLVDAEGISTFTALQRRGIPSQLLYFPDENHWVLKAKNSIVWHDTVIGWLDQWLKK